MEFEIASADCIINYKSGIYCALNSYERSNTQIECTQGYIEVKKDANIDHMSLKDNSEASDMARTSKMRPRTKRINISKKQDSQYQLNTKRLISAQSHCHLRHF